MQRDPHGRNCSTLVAQTNPVARVGPVLDSFTGDSARGSTTHNVQHILNGISARSTNQAHHKAQDHAHNTDPQVQVRKEKCPFVRTIRAGHRVHSPPVAFTQDMQLYMRIPEIPDFCVYATGLNTSGLKLYIAYVPDLPTQVYELSVGDFKRHPDPDIFNSSPSEASGPTTHNEPYISQGTASAEFNNASDIGTQDHDHRIDPPQEQALKEEDMPIEVGGGELKEGTVRCCLCDQVFKYSTLGDHLRWNHKSDIGDKRTCPVCYKATDPHNYSRHFVTHCYGLRFKCPFPLCPYPPTWREDNRKRHAMQCRGRHI